MRASRVRTATCAYDIEIRWGDGPVLYREHVYPPEPFALVARASHAARTARTYVVDEAWIGAASLTVVSVRDGEAVVHDDARERPLVLGTEVRSCVGPLEVRITASEPELAERAAAQVDVQSHAWTLASLGVHLVALGCMAFMPPKASSLSLDRLNEDVRYMQYLAKPAAVEPAELPWGNDGGKEPGESAKAPGERGKAGGESAPSNKRLAVKGKDRERAVPRVDARNAGTQGILGVLLAAKHQVGSDSPYASDQALGYDPVTALGRLFGDEIGDAPGSGLGLDRVGRGGGGPPLGTIGVGTLGTRGHGGCKSGDGECTGYGPGARGIPGRGRPTRVPEAISGVADVRGSLSKEVIRRHIQRHIAEVRYCYEDALRARPDLAGRVSVFFTIAPQGNVQSAAIKDSTLGHAGAEACVAQVVRRIGFPAPEGGGLVQVTYPFMFEAAH